MSIETDIFGTSFSWKTHNIKYHDYDYDYDYALGGITDNLVTLFLFKSESLSLV